MWIKNIGNLRYVIYGKPLKSPNPSLKLLEIFQLYLIMFDDTTSGENDTADQGNTGALGELALRTGGEIIHVPDDVFKDDGGLGLVRRKLEFPQLS